MNQHLRLGPIALLLLTISVCLTVMTLLAVAGARADLSLSQKYADTVALRYELEAEGEAYLQSLQGAPEGTYTKTFTKEGLILSVEVRTGGEAPEVLSWTYGRAWEENDSLNVWQP